MTCYGLTPNWQSFRRPRAMLLYDTTKPKYEERIKMWLRRFYRIIAVRHRTESAKCEAAPWSVFIREQFTDSFRVSRERKNILSLCFSVVGSVGSHAYWIQRRRRPGVGSIPSHLFLSRLHSAAVVACGDAPYIDKNTAIKDLGSIDRSKLDLLGQNAAGRNRSFLLLATFLKNVWTNVTTNFLFKL